MRSKPSRKYTHHPLLCWDIASQAAFRQKGSFQILAFAEAHRQQQWRFPFPVIDRSDFESIVLTDLHERIVWASPGFKQMTGYTVRSAQHRKPSFLQGPDTEPAIRATIKEALRQQQRIATTITNYRRNGEKYLCHVDILPLFAEGQLVNFMALEKEAF